MLADQQRSPLNFAYLPPGQLAGTKADKASPELRRCALEKPQ
jgi:hypothetical protein